MEYTGCPLLRSLGKESSTILVQFGVQVYRLWRAQARSRRVPVRRSIFHSMLQGHQADMIPVGETEMDLV